MFVTSATTTPTSWFGDIQSPIKRGNVCDKALPRQWWSRCFIQSPIKRGNVCDAADEVEAEVATIIQSPIKRGNVCDVRHSPTGVYPFFFIQSPIKRGNVCDCHLPWYNWLWPACFKSTTHCIKNIV